MRFLVANFKIVEEVTVARSDIRGGPVRYRI